MRRLLAWCVPNRALTWRSLGRGHNLTTWRVTKGPYSAPDHVGFTEALEKWFDLDDDVDVSIVATPRTNGKTIG